MAIDCDLFEQAGLDANSPPQDVIELERSDMLLTEKNADGRIMQVGMYPNWGGMECLLPMGVSIPAMSAGILVDPGFESGVESWKKHFWVGEEGVDVDLVIDEQVAKTGNKSARITAYNTDSKANWEFLYRPDPGVLQTGQSHFARFAVKVEALASTAPAWMFHGVHVRLTSHGPDWSGTHQTSLKPISFEGDWAIFEGITILP